jgi:hypothetical protein
MKMVSSQSRLKVNVSDIAAKVIDGEAILINVASGMYYSMDNAGAVVWELIQEGHSLAQISECIAARYDAPLETVRADIERLGDELLERNIVALDTEPALPLDVQTPSSKQPYNAPVLNSYDDMSDLLALDPPMPGVEDIS